MRTGAAATVVESADPISDPQPRPEARRFAVPQERILWVVNYDAAQNRKLQIAPGGLGTALWSGDGRTIDYLNIPADRKQLNNIRELHSRYK